MNNLRQQFLAFAALFLVFAVMVIPWEGSKVGAFAGTDIIRVSTVPTACVPEKSPIWLLTAAPYGLYRCSATDSITQVGLGPLNGANGSSLTLNKATVSINGAAAATISATNLIPAGSLLVGVTIRVTSTFSNTSLTSFTAGDGTTADLFGTGVALTSGTTTTYANHKTTFTPKIYQSATSIVLTGTGASFAANGTAEIVIFYYSLTAPTS